MDFIAKQLVNLGLTAMEGQIYLTLLQHQLTTAGALAKYTKFKRSTVYTILDSLINKGLVSKTQIAAVKHFQAEPPDRLFEFLEKEEIRLQEKKKLFNDLQDDLKSLYNKKIKTPKITIYEGKKGVDNLLIRNLEDRPREVLVLGAHMAEEDLIKDYTNRRISMKIPTKIIIPDSKLARNFKKADKKEFRQTKILSAKYKFPASIHIYDDSVSIFTSTGDDQVGVYIENTDITETLKLIFHLISRK